MMYIVRVCDARVDRHPQKPLESPHEISRLPLQRPHTTVDRAVLLYCGLHPFQSYPETVMDETWKGRLCGFQLGKTKDGKRFQNTLIKGKIEYSVFLTLKLIFQYKNTITSE